MKNKNLEHLSFKIKNILKTDCPLNYLAFKKECEVGLHFRNSERYFLMAEVSMSIVAGNF